MKIAAKLNKIEYSPAPNYENLLGSDWAQLLEEGLLNTTYMKNLNEFLNLRYKSKGMWPRRKDLFENFRITPFGKLRVVIVGDEPFNDFRATGIPMGNQDAFGSILSPALRVWNNAIEKEFYDGLRMYGDTSNRELAKQGVMFLDVASTSDSLLRSSYKMHWRNFTRQVIKTIVDWHPTVIFVFMGKDAKKFDKYILKSNYRFYMKHPNEIKAHKELDCSVLREVNDILAMQNIEADQIEW